jgi:hypothetical protein
MNSFWGCLYDWSKDRRYAALFLATFIIFLGLTILGVMVCSQSSTLNLRFACVLPGMCALGFALVCIIVRCRRGQHQNSSDHPALSRDEWDKARSKLLKEKQFRKL